MLSERVPAEGLLILRDGESEAPEVMRSPLRLSPARAERAHDSVLGLIVANWVDKRL